MKLKDGDAAAQSASDTSSNRESGSSSTAPAPRRRNQEPTPGVEETIMPWRIILTVILLLGICGLLLDDLFGKRGGAVQGGVPLPPTTMVNLSDRVEENAPTEQVTSVKLEAPEVPTQSPPTPPPPIEGKEKPDSPRTPTPAEGETQEPKSTKAEPTPPVGDETPAPQSVPKKEGPEEQKSPSTSAPKKDADSGDEVPGKPSTDGNTDTSTSSTTKDTEKYTNAMPNGDPTPDPGWIAMIPKKPLAPEVMEASKALYKNGFTTTFPTQHALQITTDKIVDKRGIKIDSFFPCFGNFTRYWHQIPGAVEPKFWGLAKYAQNEKDVIEALPPRYDVVFLPIGCFGDFVPAPDSGKICTNAACNLGPKLASMASCGIHRFGSFLGDNFYPRGLAKRRDPRFEWDLETKFWRHEALQMKYYSTVGNHDRKPRYQLRHTHPFWIMPAFSSVSPVQVARKDLGGDESVTVQVFLIDTHWGFAKNTPELMQKQADWLDSALGNSTAHWKIVASHEPIWGFMGFPHSKSLVEMVHPVLVRHKVPVYVCAHAHGVHLHRVKGGYHQLTSAGFSESYHIVAKPKRPPGFYHMGTGATAMLFNNTHTVMAAFDERENMIFAHALAHPSTPEGAAHFEPQPSDRDVMWSPNLAYCKAFRPFVVDHCGNNKD